MVRLVAGYVRTMALVRVLPARLAPRFARAARFMARTPTASFEVIAADRLALRLRGLAGLDPAKLVPLVIPRCRSVHTFGMRCPIDVVWLEAGPGEDELVRGVDAAVPPRRLARAPRDGPRRRIAALELPAGDAVAFGLHAGVRLQRLPASRPDS